jgi:hypothetical protein
VIPTWSKRRICDMRYILRSLGLVGAPVDALS